MNAVAIIAAGGGSWKDEDAALRARAILDAAGKRPRRVNRFIEIALAGALDCCREQLLDSAAGVYLATRYGDVRETAQQLEETRRELPMPVSFINISGNMAGHYIAGALGARGPNIAISAEHGVFGRALELAVADLAAGAVRQALVGHVEEAGLDADGCAQSRWLLLGATETPVAMLARAPADNLPLAVPTAADLVEWLRRPGTGGMRLGLNGAAWRLEKTRPCR